MSKKVFISYRSSDRDIVSRLAQDIAKLQYTVWFDKQLTGGQSWWNQILEQIRACDIVVVALSPDVTNSEACRYERTYARLLGKVILPVVVADRVVMSHFEPELGNIQNVDYRFPNADAALALATAMHNLPQSLPLPANLPEPPPVPGSYLNTLSSDVNRPDINYQQQNAILGEIKRHIYEEDRADEVLPLLERFSERPDISQSIAQESKELLAKLRGDAAHNIFDTIPDDRFEFQAQKPKRKNDADKLETWLYYLLLIGGFLIPILGWIAGGIVMFTGNGGRRAQGRNVILAGVLGFVFYYACNFIVAMNTPVIYPYF